MRWSLVKGALPEPSLLVQAGLIALIVFVAGTFLFRRMERRMADII
jgi:ABC-type polysaccharide/polyol phosphate export permease